MSGREADAALADVGLTGAAGQLVRDLSGGQKGRVSLACALLADSTPAQLRVDGRSQALEEAFLTVVRAREEVAA
jgi:ABC-type uncharacterized transport system YnjBCD ATPase subunit